MADKRHSFREEHLDAPVNRTEPALVLEGGARRSEKKPPYYMLELEALAGTARRMEMGRLHHGRDNFKSGGPEYIVETYNHLFDHVLRFGTGVPDAEGDTVQDHLDAVGANYLILAWHLKHHPENFERLWHG